MHPLQKLFDNNEQWAANVENENPGFFARLAAQQAPEYLWIGCSDSRVPANEIVGLLPGELFVHRNVANLVLHTDMNCLSVLQYAVESLKVKHVIICGHYGCGGVRSAMERRPHGLIDNWLRNVQDIYRRRYEELKAITDLNARCDRLCEMNVIEQAINISYSTVIQEAWSRGQHITIHGWIYSISNGLLKDLAVCLASRSDVKALEEREKITQLDG
ncbi:MAG TPA: carbonate dehydratase [Kiritimatiellia bacterium]|nr:carbonate dehydratase [Kiritimatiellia bacterium]